MSQCGIKIANQQRERLAKSYTGLKEVKRTRKSIKKKESQGGFVRILVSCEKEMI